MGEQDYNSYEPYGVLLTSSCCKLCMIIRSENEKYTWQNYVELLNFTIKVAFIFCNSHQSISEADERPKIEFGTFTAHYFSTFEILKEARPTERDSLENFIHKQKLNEEDEQSEKENNVKTQLCE